MKLSVEGVQKHGALAVLALVTLVGLLAFPGFRTVDNAGTLLVNAAPLGLIALGMTFVILTGGIDLSVGSVFVLGGVVAAWASQYGFVAALVVPLLVGAAVGLVNGVLVARTNMAPFIVTLATLLGARGLMRAVSTEGSTTYLVESQPFKTLGNGDLLGVKWPVWIAAVLFVAGSVVLNRTGFGQAVYAVGGNTDAARLMGVPVAATQIRVYALSGLLAGFAGALNAARLGSGVTVLGIGTELDAIAAVVIGGTLLTGGAGALSGTIAGVLLLGVIQNLINQVGDVPTAYQQVVSGAFLAVVVVAQTSLTRLRSVAPV
ncbi:sugar ABC transporter permease [Virgisporangium aliadipatigenens]|uniref:Sugar ABC transporter permease n=1 Tax=Virgisporangium aliadipatigenens TaxID=741659 RepID=A0A8J3YJA0_9ACTN|nr:ABC transporter permease [Virgisporangium aliadipatigenens]GIJ46439.1 sugar ABC transporter permease [Virgisporangium aliadipatigenens]